MQLEEFIEKFAACFNNTDIKTITPATDFRKLDEWGSMMALIVIAMIDSDYGKEVTADDLKNARTVAELFEIVKNK